MKDMIESRKDLDGVSETRDSKYPMYIPGDARLEGFCTVSELKARIDRLERLVQELSAAAK